MNQFQRLMHRSKQFLGVFSYSKTALLLVWQTSKPLALTLMFFTLLAGVLPAAMAYTGKLIVDGTIAAMANYQSTQAIQWRPVLDYVVLEALLVCGLAASQRTLSMCQTLLRIQLTQQVNLKILHKAQRLELSQFENSDYYDLLNRAKNEASSRPISLVIKTFSVLQNLLVLSGLAVLLVQFSYWALLLLMFSALPGFIAEAKFSEDSFRLSSWHSPETRMQIYLETILTREDCVKEVRLFQLGNGFITKYQQIYQNHYKEDRRLAVRRESWGLGLGAIGTLTLYLAYGWIVISTVMAKLTIGQMTMYLIVFRQGQTAINATLTSISGMYEDNLYLSVLSDFLELPEPALQGKATIGLIPGDGIRFEQVNFIYPGATKAALSEISLHLRPGESLAIVGENGAGKSTLIKLLSRLYQPTTGRILLDGLPLEEWDAQIFYQRIGVIFQDFLRFQFTVGENIGTGDISHQNDELRWHKAASQANAKDFIQQLPQGYKTQLGRWFSQGQELSGGQWQRIALARSFMRQQADILVLDEPTAAMDAEAEAQIFSQFQEHSHNKMTILISHRFSTIRAADQILVMEHGRIIEKGNHQSLISAQGRYAELFELQAQGYA